MTDSAGAFFIELSSLFDPKGFNEADKRLKQSGSSYDSYFDALSSQSSAWSDNFISASARASLVSTASLKSFFDATSKNFLNLETLAKEVFDGMLANFLSAMTQMAASSALSGILSLGGESVFGSLLGSRQSGGPIDETGPYLLHAGEYVIPSQQVSALTAQSNGVETLQASSSSAAVINITLNSPVTLNGTASSEDAKKLCKEISEAARRGVSWAVEQAKISYKIGKQKSGEVSL
jgi:hypothetical protein